MEIKETVHCLGVHTHTGFFTVRGTFFRASASFWFFSIDGSLYEGGLILEFVRIIRVYARACCMALVNAAVRAVNRNRFPSMASGQLNTPHFKRLITPGWSLLLITFCSDFTYSPHRPSTLAAANEGGGLLLAFSRRGGARPPTRSRTQRYRSGDGLHSAGSDGNIAARRHQTHTYGSAARDGDRAHAFG